MTTTRLHRSFASRAKMRGVANLLAVMFLVTVIMVVLASTMTMTSSDIFDSTAQGNSVKALFLAESGLERALSNYGTSGVCDATNVGTGATAYSLGAGSFTLDTATPNGIYCQVTVTGQVGNVARRLSANFTAGGAAMAQDTFNSTATNAASSSLTLTIGSGSNRLLVVAVYSDKGKGTVTGISYDGVSILANNVVTGGSGNNPGVDVYYLVNPPSGTKTLAWTTTGTGSTVVNAVAFTGVNQTSPFNASAVSALFTNTTPTLSITTTASNAWVLSFLASDNNTAATPAQTLIVTNAYNTNIRGSSSRTGTVASPQTVTMDWTLASSRKWILGAVALTPAGGNPTVAQWSEVIN